MDVVMGLIVVAVVVAFALFNRNTKTKTKFQRLAPRLKKNKALIELTQKARVNIQLALMGIESLLKSGPRYQERKVSASREPSDPDETKVELCHGCGCIWQDEH